MSEKSKLHEQLQDKPYREAFVFSQMSIPISFQIRALREQRGLTQKQLAEKAGMLQPRIVELERPKGKEPNLRTLARLAAAFDVALIVRFAPFSELVEWAKNFSPDTFVIPSFEDDPGLHEGVTASIQNDVAIVMDAGASMTDLLQETKNLLNRVSPRVELDSTTVKPIIMLNDNRFMASTLTKKISTPELLPNLPHELVIDNMEKKAS